MCFTQLFNSYFNLASDMVMGCILLSAEVDQSLMVGKGDCLKLFSLLVHLVSISSFNFLSQNLLCELAWILYVSFFQQKAKAA